MVTLRMCLLVAWVGPVWSLVPSSPSVKRRSRVASSGSITVGGMPYLSYEDRRSPLRLRVQKAYRVAGGASSVAWAGCAFSALRTHPLPMWSLAQSLTPLPVLWYAFSACGDPEHCHMTRRTNVGLAVASA